MPSFATVPVIAIVPPQQASPDQSPVPATVLPLTASVQLSWDPGTSFGRIQVPLSVFGTGNFCYASTPLWITENVTVLRQNRAALVNFVSPHHSASSERHRLEPRAPPDRA